MAFGKAECLKTITRSAYNDQLKGMAEWRMRQTIFTITSFWYTACVNAGQPDLTSSSNKIFLHPIRKSFKAQ